MFFSDNTFNDIGGLKCFQTILLFKMLMNARKAQIGVGVVKMLCASTQEGATGVQELRAPQDFLGHLSVHAETGEKITTICDVMYRTNTPADCMAY